jgi:hypothetical protein
MSKEKNYKDKNKTEKLRSPNILPPFGVGYMDQMMPYYLMMDHG